MRKTSKAIAPLVVGAFALAACGGDDSTDNGGPSSSSETDTTGGDTTDATTADSSDSGDTGGGTIDATTADSSESGEKMEEATGEPIKVGVIGDLTGAFAGLVTEILEAQKVYFDAVNAEGGIGGRPVELIVTDAQYDIALTQEKYAELSKSEEVDIISLSTGSPHTASIQKDLVQDNLIALPLTWYSGWAFNDGIGENVYENYTNYCLESMNGIEWLNKNKDVKTVAIASFDGEYGGDGAMGAVKAAEALGLEVVYDGTGAVTTPSADNPQPDQTAVISEIVAADPDLVWTTVNPIALGSLVSGTAAQGFDGLWSGNSPTYSYKLLDTDLAPFLDKQYIQSTYIVNWGTDVPGMADMVDKMTAARPELPVSDAYVLGWTEAITTHRILEAAAESGEVNRDSIAAAAAEITIDYEGLAPTQTWVGEPNDYVVRESYIYDVSLDGYSPSTLGEADGTTGSVLLEGPYTGDLIADYDFTEPCFVG